MSAAEPLDALVIGSGPAGLMAAETLQAAGRAVTVVEAKPSAGRKFLMAGKSGLNLTKDAAPADFAAAYGRAAARLAPMLSACGPARVIAWAEGLGQPVFIGSSGRVFPTAMKASPLLRAWLRRLGEGGLRTGWRWGDTENGLWRFETRDGPRALRPRVVVLALGGASWRRLGADGAWAPALAARGVGIAPFKPANMGFVLAWSDHMTPHFGAPLKGVAFRRATGDWVRGEAVISARGIEGGGVYAVAADVRDGAPLVIDLLPDLAAAEIARRLAARPRKRSLGRHLAQALRLDPVKRALLNEVARPLPDAPEALARRLKALTLPHAGPRPMDEAISTAGGVAWESLDTGLMLHAWPGVFCAGEMIDWEAPTGGYLITGCLATGAWAGRHAADWIAGTGPETAAAAGP
jgi:uncharacterized flavoprotein (TIGR03862 family)